MTMNMKTNTKTNMNRLVLRALFLFSFAVLSFGETVEVSADGEATNGVVCPAECVVSTEWQKRVIELEQTNAGLSSKAQSCQDSNTELSNQLREAVKRAETVTAEKSSVDSTCNDQLQAVQANLLESANLRKNLEQSTKECTGALDSAIERENQFKVEADAQFADFRAQIDDLLSHKHKASEMEELVKSLNDDLDKHKSELTSTRDSLTKDLEDHRAKLREKSDSYSQSRKELFAANERLRELDLMVSTTYINTTLIQRDIIIGAKKAATYSAECVASAQEAATPYWTKLVDFCMPHWKNFLAFYNDTILVEVSKATKIVKDNYDEHVKPSLEEHVFPVLEPVVTPIREHLSKFHLMASNALKQACQSLLNYVELMDDKDFMFQKEITTTLKSAEKDSPKALNYLLVGIVVTFLLFRMLSRRRRAKKAKKAAAAAEKPAVTVNNRKGLRAARNSKPNPTTK